MAKAIASYPKEQQGKVISSRLQNQTGGLGYLSAREAEYQQRMAELRKQIVKAEKPESSGGK